MNLAFKIFVAKNKIIGTILPKQAAKSARELFFTPRKHPIKAWEEDLERQGKRIQLSNGLSAITWGDSHQKVLLVHGWESRATQMAGFVDTIMEAGFQVLALDGPAHGHSSGTQANPLMFAQAILQANDELGPFEAVIGHSMGGSAVAIALSEGLESQKVVLIASPSSIENILKRFAKFIGLPATSTHAFLSLIAEKVGRSAPSLEIAELIKASKSQGLIIHDQSDVEVPYDDAIAIQKNWKDSTLMTTQGYGHRKILKQTTVWSSIISFILTEKAST